MDDRENSLEKKFTPTLIFEYINTYTKNKHITYCEFKGFTKVNSTEYILVWSFTDIYDVNTKSYDRHLEFIELELFKLFILKKRFSQ